MRVVSNTSPLSNLAIVDRLPLLWARYGRVSIPPAVWDELQALAHLGGRGRLAQALSDGFLSVDSPPTTEHVNRYLESIDRGEAEALALAVETHADVLLMDERKGRLLAKEIGQPFSGILGLLLWAKDRGMIESVTAEMVRLVIEARFFIHPDLQALLRREAGED